MSGKGETFKDSKGHTASVLVRQKDENTIETVVANDKGSRKETLDIEEARKMHEALGSILKPKSK